MFTCIKKESQELPVVSEADTAGGSPNLSPSPAGGGSMAHRKQFCQGACCELHHSSDFVFEEN